MARTTLGRIVATAVVAVALNSSASQAQSRGGGMGMPRYDKATETTVKGTVDDVQSVQGGGGGGVHLAVKADAGVLDVRVGPATWLADKEYTFAKGDQIEIIASKIAVDGKAVFIARQIKKGDVVMTLRDENGVPGWSHGGARPK